MLKPSLHATFGNVANDTDFDFVANHMLSRVYEVVVVINAFFCYFSSVQFFMTRYLQKCILSIDDNKIRLNLEIV